MILRLQRTLLFLIKTPLYRLSLLHLNYTSPEKKQYAYMLEGFDNTWNEVGTKRTATYTNLDAGTYLFKVKGLNNDGNWSSSCYKHSAYYHSTFLAYMVV